MSKPKVTLNNDPVKETKYPQSIASGTPQSQPKVSMFADDMGSCRNRTNSGEGSQSKPSL